MWPVLAHSSCHMMTLPPDSAVLKRLQRLGRSARRVATATRSSPPGKGSSNEIIRHGRACPGHDGGELNAKNSRYRSRGRPRHAPAQASASAFILTSAGATCASPPILPPTRISSPPTSPISPRWKKIAAGVDGIVHLGGYSIEGPWDTILNANIVGCYNLFEAAYRAKRVKRVVFASSNHAVGFYPRTAPYRRQRHGAPGHPLRREQGIRRSARCILCRQARPARHVPAHRQCRRRAGR